MSLFFDVELPRRDFLLKLKVDFGTGTVGIYGPSGAGKTSLFSLLAGLEKPSSGRIVLNGRVLSDTEQKIFVPPHKRRIGVVYQEKLLFPHMTVRENLLFGRKYVEKSQRKISLNDVVALMNLSEFLDAYPKDISGGEQQRVGIGRALLTSPEMLLLDEPFNAVDNRLRLAILPYIRKVGEELKIPMLVISHDLPDIQRLTDQVFVMDKGQCLGFGHILDILGENRTILEDAGVVNTMNCSNPTFLEKGFYSCSVEGLPGREIKIPKAPSEYFKIVVPPNEIALSTEEIKGISIQNQLPGKVVSVVNSGNSLYCIIDVGIRLASKVTYHTVNEMNIREGSNIWCLFKSHAVLY